MSGMTKLELVLEAIDRASGPLRGVQRAIDSVERAAGRSSSTMSRLGDIGGKAMRAIGTAAKIGAVAGITALIASLGAGIKEAVAFETALIEIQKKAGTTAEQTAAIGDKIIHLATGGELAASMSEIWSAYERGAAAGLAGADLDKFAKLSAKAADAFGMSSEDVGNAAAGFHTGLGIAMTDMERYFDLINGLADSGIANERDIVNFLDRVGAQLKVFGESAEQSAAIGATLLNLKMAPDVAARMMDTLTSKLLAPGSDEATGALAEIVGDQKKFNKLLKEKPNEALLLYLDKIKELDKFKAAELLTSHLGQGFSGEVIRLAQGVDELRRNLALAEDEAKWFGSLDRSYGLKLQTFAAQWQIFKNGMSTMRIRAVMPFLPALTAGLEHLSGIMRTVGERATLFTRLGAAMNGFASGLGPDVLGGAADAVRSLGQAIEEFLFGVADADASADRVGRIFMTMQSLGRSVRPVLDAASNGMARFGDLLTSMGSGLAGMGSSIAAGFLPHLDALSTKFGSVVETVQGSVGNLISIAMSIGEALTTAFASAGGAGVVLGDFGGKAIGVALDLYKQFHTAVGSVLSVLAELSQKVAASVGTIDFAAILAGPLDGVLATLSGIADALSGVASFTGATLVSYFKGYFDGLEPYLAPMADRLAAIWDRLGPILTNFGRIGTEIGAMFSAIGANSGAMGAVETFGRVMGNLAGSVGNVTLTGIEGLLRWVEAMTGAMAALYEGNWAEAKASIDGFLQWIAGISLPEISIDLTQLKAAFEKIPEVVQEAWDRIKESFAWLASIQLPTITIDLTQMKAAFEALVGVVRDALEALKRIFDQIVTAASGVGLAIAKAIGAVDLSSVDMLRAAIQQPAGRVLSGDGLFGLRWDAGEKMLADLEAGKTTLDQIEATMRQLSVSGEGSGFGLDVEARARAVLETIEKIRAAGAALPVAAAPAAPTVDTVAAAQGEVDALNSAIASATTAGNALPTAIAGALQSARSIVAAFDLTSEGARIMASFNAGFMSGGTAAAGIMVSTMASVRAAAFLNLSAQGANIMNTLAAGMRARAGAVVEEIRKVTQSVRDHLPSSPAKTGPLSDIHRLKFGETIASSIRPEPVVRAMAGLAAAGMDAAAPLDRRLGIVSGAQRRATAEPRTRPGIFAAAARETQERRGSSGPSGPIDASLHIGAVHYSKPEDKAEFEALLRRHSRTVADVVSSETRRSSRLAF